MPETKVEDSIQTSRLPLPVKLVYGSGDWGVASFGTLRQIYYAIFLTDVVGLDPRLASFAALLGSSGTPSMIPWWVCSATGSAPVGAGAGLSCCSSPTLLHWASCCYGGRLPGRASWP